MSTNAERDHDFEATADVSALRIARVYAQALVDAADQKQATNDVAEELESLVKDVFKADPRFEAFLSSGAVDRRKKAEIIRSVFGPRGANPVFINFLLVLNNHERLNLLRSILRALQEIQDRRARRIRVLVRSAAPLGEEQQHRLRQELRETFQREPLLETEVDPALLGGMIVKVGDWVYDASVRTKLQTIRNQIIERSSYEIQSRRDRFGID